MKQLEKQPHLLPGMPQGLEWDSQKARPLGEKQPGSVNTVAQMLTGLEARRLGAGLSPRVRVEGGGRSRLPGAMSQPDPRVAWPGLWLPGTR